MSVSVGASSVSILSESEWKELEIPYGKVRDKWDDYYYAQLKEASDRGLITKKTLNCYFEVLDIDEDIYKKEEAIKKIVEKEEKIGYDLYSVVRFCKNKRKDIVEDCFKKVSDSSEGTDLEDHHSNISDSPDRVAMVTVLHFVEPRVMRDILALDYCYGKKPQEVVDKESGDLIGEVEDSTDEIIEHLEDIEFRDYDLWHHFEHKDDEYLLIKRQINDDVERQASGNLEEEPAEFVVLRFRNNQLEILSEDASIADSAKTGVSESVEDVEFEDEPESVSRNRFIEFVSELEDQDEDNSELWLVGIDVASSPLPGHPSIEMKGEDGITRALEALREDGYDLTNPVDDVVRLIVEFEEKEYTLYPEPIESDDDQDWMIRYGAGRLDDLERRRFEGLIQESFEVQVRFEKVG